MNDRLGGPSRRIAVSANRREWLWTIAAILGMLAIYFTAPFGQHDDPLPLKTATFLTVVLALVLASMITHRVIRLLGGNSAEGLPGLVILLAFVVVGFSSAYFMLNRSDPTRSRDSTPGSTRCTSFSPR